MTKFKHNKKRNTAFLYESLIIELTKAILINDKEKQFQIKTMVKEGFNNSSMMRNDLKIYQAINETSNVEKEIAQRILTEAKKQKEQIDKKQLFNEQNKIIAQINKFLPKSFFSNFVPNYKNLASIAQIFNDTVSIKSRVLLESEVIEKMIEKDCDQEMLPIDSLTYKIFIEKFNHQYGDKLLEEQKTLLEKYITSFENNGLELKIYLNEEVGRLRDEVEGCFSRSLIKDDEKMQHKINEVISTLDDFKSREPTEQMLMKIISIQSLVKEIHANAN